MKKKIITVLTLLMLSIIGITGFGINVKAECIGSVDLIEETKMTENVLYQHYQMLSSPNQQTTKQIREVYTYTMKPSQYAKLATWTYSNPDKYQLKTLVEIAKDYEKNHPGWIVLGGVNAEGYYNGELTNAFVQDGDVIRKDVSAESFKKLIGFKDDGTYVIKQVPTSSQTPLLKINNESFVVSRVNALPEDGGISVITKDLAETLDLSGYSVIEATYSLYRKSTQFPDPRKTHSGSFYGIFLKGKVNSLVNLSTLSSSDCSNRRFYLVTKRQDVAGKLTQDQEIKIQFDYTDEFKDVTSMTGYMYRFVIDGKSIPTSYVETNDFGERISYNDSYCTTTGKQRCGIGFKKDGSIVLLTSNTKKEGPSGYEVGEMFVELGCENAYQFDGGGSVTFLKRAENGELKMLNTPGDGAPRSIMSGLFIVAPDPRLSQSNRETTASTIILTPKSADLIEGVTNLKVTINEKEYTMQDGKVVINGLQENTTYVANVQYDYQGTTYNATMNVTTKAYDPGVDINPTSKGFNVGLRQSDENLITSKVTIRVEEQEYVIENSEGKLTSYEITGLFKDDSYRISYTYEVTIKESGEKYTRSVEEKTYRTLSYDIPEITEFSLKKRTGNKATVNYTIEDVDGLITKMYLVYNVEKVELEIDSNKYQIEELDMNKVNTFKLVVEYETPDGKTKEIESEELTLGEEHVHEWVEATCTAPKTCKTCGATEGEALGHDWKEATTEAPKTCTRCGATEGEKLPTEKPKKNCKKTSLISILVSLTVLAGCLVIRKKHN